MYPRVYDVRRFVAYLIFAYCDKGPEYPQQVVVMRNTLNGRTTSVPLNERMIAVDMMYWNCRDLDVDMPPGFGEYQRMMDNASPPNREEEHDLTSDDLV